MKPDPVTRLRESRQRFDEFMYQAGVHLGREWAKNDAEAIELERWEQHVEKCDQEHGLTGWLSCNSAAYSPAERLAFIAQPSAEGHREEARGFWDAAIHVIGEGDDTDHLEFLRGFVEGALAFWSEVKDEVLQPPPRVLAVGPEVVMERMQGASLDD